MVDASANRPHMPVKGSDGEHVGTVDHLDGGSDQADQEQLRRRAAPLRPLSWVARVDEHVHLSMTKAAALAGAGVAATATATATGTAAARPREKLLPAVDPRRGRLLLLLLLFKSCVDGKQDTTMAAEDRRGADDSAR
jgi:hypothetical protein